MALTQDQLYNAQQKYSPYIQGAIGLTSLANQFAYDQNKNNYININPPSSELDSTGKPMYNLGQTQQNINQIDVSGPSVGSVGTGALTGASIGANPELAAATGGLSILGGAVLGGGISAISGILGSRTARRKRELARQNLLSAQRIYNNQIAAYNAQQSGQQLYNDLANNNRDFNIYKYNSPYS